MYNFYGNCWEDEHFRDSLGSDVLTMKVVSKTRNLEFTHKPLESYTDIIKRHLGMGLKRDLELKNVNMLVNGYSQSV